MEKISLLNSIIGPVMRGPSSSHAAAPYMIGKAVRELSLSNNEKFFSVKIIFAPNGSFSQVYSNQGSDEGFASGLLGISIESPEYADALKILKQSGPFKFNIEIDDIKNNNHPNRVDLVVECTEKTGRIRKDIYQAVSTGGGMFLIEEINSIPVMFSGESGVVIIEGESVDTVRLLCELESFRDLFIEFAALYELPVVLKSKRPMTDPEKRIIYSIPGIQLIREADASQYCVVCKESKPFCAADIIKMAANKSLDCLAREYEAKMLGMSEEMIHEKFVHRMKIMLKSVEEGLKQSGVRSRMKFLTNTSGLVAENKTAANIAGNIMHRAVYGALAVMELNTNRGIVCAAPTAGSSGILPGCLYSLGKEGFSHDELARALEVMAFIGYVIASGATFAAEKCGCAAETGSAAAMAAGGIAHIYGASPDMVFDAASLCLMNTMGLICDPVGGEVEIPCHSRNIAGVAHAYTAAMAASGGFKAVLPFDEIVDILSDVGEKTCTDFLCTAKGGLAITPTALRLK